MVGVQKQNLKPLFFTEEMVEMDSVLSDFGFTRVSIVKGLRTPAEAHYQVKDRPGSEIVIRGNGIWSHRDLDGDQVHIADIGCPSLAAYVKGLLPRGNLVLVYPYW